MLIEDEAQIEDEVETMNPLMRMLAMLEQGNLTVTIKNEARGHHETFRLSPRLPRGLRGRDSWSGTSWWLNLVNGTSERTYVGMVDVKNGRLAITYTQASDSRKGVRYAAELVISSLVTGDYPEPNALGETYSLVPADLCGRCSRELTDPVSIERGIGPECYGKVTGSKRAHSHS